MSVTLQSVTCVTVTEYHGGAKIARTVRGQERRYGEMKNNIRYYSLYYVSFIVFLAVLSGLPPMDKWVFTSIATGAWMIFILLAIWTEETMRQIDKNP